MAFTTHHTPFYLRLHTHTRHTRILHLQYIPTAHANSSCSQQRVCDMCWIRFTRSLVGSDFDFIYIFDDRYEYEWSGLLHLPSTPLSNEIRSKARMGICRRRISVYVFFSLPFIRNDANGGDGVDGNDLNATEFTFNSRCKIVCGTGCCVHSQVAEKIIYTATWML